MRLKTPYRCVAKSVAGFVQQVAVSYIAHGYWFYVTGIIPAKKDPTLTDRKILDQYGIDISKWARSRRKCAGLPGLHYLRHDHFFVILSNEKERFVETEKQARDVRRDSISFEGYSIGYKRDGCGKWHPSVRIHPKVYRDLKAYFLEQALRTSSDKLAEELCRLPFEPYAPVRTQFECILRAINKARGVAGLDEVCRSALRVRRKPLTVF